jgi:hypothetical protein
MAERLASRRVPRNDPTFLAGEFLFFSCGVGRVINSVEQADIKTWVKTVSNPKLLDEPSLLDPLLKTDGWQTLMTFTRESAREFHVKLLVLPNTRLIAQQKLHGHRALHPAHPLTWTMTFHKRCLTRLQPRKLRTPQPQPQLVGRAAVVSRSVPTVPLKTKRVGWIVMFVGCPCRLLSNARIQPIEIVNTIHHLHAWIKGTPNVHVSFHRKNRIVVL